MVWHALMLNPRDYLEDCARFGLKDLWATGMPWALINQAIDTSFNYSVHGDAKADFAATTGHTWENVDDSPTKSLQCPMCPQIIEVPWTTIDADEKSSALK